MLFLYNPHLIRAHSSIIYYYGRIATITPSFSYNDRTVEQLGNAGNFRLIRNHKLRTE
jgi:hypothetical protein